MADQFNTQNQSIVKGIPLRSKFVFELFKHQQLHPFYRNTVQNSITGKQYLIAHNFADDPKALTYLVSDIPSYLILANSDSHKQFKSKKVKQYPGFLIDLKNTSSADTYINSKLSRRNIKRIQKNHDALISNHNCSFRAIIGHISKEECNSLMDTLSEYLKNRFNEKRIRNRYLGTWNTYREEIFEKINKGSASLFVITDRKKPICITLNYHLEDVLFSELEGHHPAFGKYSLGDISMKYHLDWCTRNNVQLMDLSIGKTAFKLKWCNHQYDFCSHVHYRKNNLFAQAKSQCLSLILNLKQRLRNSGVAGGIINLDRILFILKGQNK
ncbi:GNAT family N-acetyltransferase [Muricauda sp. 2012CJ35-5]|uniref:GNAT family N-acetyltransferase n=1 Tax=Flagellimonas spongiicola TaxID=2942208 RepID=A0ABT0PVX0_9FLAO|nr:GNAT family N-acetyltransferase [Allomuricauda spongiicola]MCL6275528.1 GNAT family N-acetyltransferase [Allomuricauda spongiicola]